MFFEKATKIEEIFTVDLTLCIKCQIDSEGSVNFVAFLENTNFKKSADKIWFKNDKELKSITPHVN